MIEAHSFLADPAPPLALLTQCPAYAPTPLVGLATLARETGWSGLLAKDETARMGLGSFKALGGVYAVACRVRAACAAAWGHAPDPAALRTPEVAAVAGRLTFACASAGNHGLAVAAGAALFGARAVVYVAETVPEGFVRRLRAKGAEARRHGATYEDSMEAARRDAAARGWQYLSDSAQPGDMAVPALVMQGYTVMAEEVRRACAGSGCWPSHVALQAGVGGMAGAVAGHIRAVWPCRPEIVVVEPDRAACLRQSVAAGRPVRADGPVSCMGRLDCKEPSWLALAVLRSAADRFVTVEDAEAEAAAERLARHGLPTTPSGAAGLAGLLALALPSGARPLILVTEANMP